MIFESRDCEARDTSTQTRVTRMAYGLRKKKKKKRRKEERRGILNENDLENEVINLMVFNFLYIVWHSGSIEDFWKIFVSLQGVHSWFMR